MSTANMDENLYASFCLASLHSCKKQLKETFGKKKGLEDKVCGS